MGLSKYNLINAPADGSIQVAVELRSRYCSSAKDASGSGGMQVVQPSLLSAVISNRLFCEKQQF
jgi:hypothetical protein